MCLFSKRLNEALVRAKLSKRRGEQRHGGGEDDSEKGKGGGEGGGRGRGECGGGCRSVQAARLVSRMSRA